MVINDASVPLVETGQSDEEFWGNFKRLQRRWVNVKIKTKCCIPNTGTSLLATTF